jgi:hypothetical protein
MQRARQRTRRRKSERSSEYCGVVVVVGILAHRDV